MKRKYIELLDSADGVGSHAGTGTLGAQLFSPAQINALSASEDLAAMHAFRAADLQVGGGHLYASVVKYLKHNLAPRLFGVSAQASTSILFSAASGLSEMAGWMAHDAGRDGAARFHFLQALDCAKCAGDAQPESTVDHGFGGDRASVSWVENAPLTRFGSSNTG